MSGGWDDERDPTTWSGHPEGKKREEPPEPEVKKSPGLLIEEDPMFSPRLRRNVRLLFILIGVALIVAFIVVRVAEAATRQKLPRDEIYYEINNDGGDFGNYIETFHVPNGRGGKVYCIVYSDKIGDGGGAGISCDWGNPR